MGMTQDRANGIMNEHIRRANNAEDWRDASDYESREYWSWHDSAMRYYKAAEQYMHRSVRTLDAFKSPHRSHSLEKGTAMNRITTAVANMEKQINERNVMLDM